MIPINLIKKLNRERLYRRKANKIISTRKIQKNKTELPESIKKIIILHFQQGWGDFLYFSGLVNFFEKNGIEVTLGTSPKLIERFSNIKTSGGVFDASDLVNSYPDTFGIDCLLDLDWVVKNDHPLKFIQESNLWSITCSPVLAHTNAFNQYIDFSKISHISQRYSFVAKSITRLNCQEIRPSINLTPKSLQESFEFLSKNNLTNKSFIYLNTLGRDSDREFNPLQIKTILNTINDKDLPVVFYSPHFNIKSYANLNLKSHLFLPVPNVDFFTLSAIISNAKAVITPDTSIVHLASTFNIPALAFFCQNDYDYFGNHLLSETWSPLSSGSFIVDNSKKYSLFQKNIPIHNLDLDISSLIKSFLSKI